MASIYLKDAYYTVTVKIDESFKKHLKFIWNQI